MPVLKVLVKVALYMSSIIYMLGAAVFSVSIWLGRCQVNVTGWRVPLLWHPVRRAHYKYVYGKYSRIKGELSSKMTLSELIWR